MGRPNANSVVAWPAPHTRPRRPARRALDAWSRSPARSAVTAVRWSGSVAWRRPSSSATASTISSVSPAPSAAMWSSSPNTVRPLLGRGGGPGGARGAEPGERRVVEAWLEADRGAHGGADGLDGLGGQHGARAAALAGGELVLARGGGVPAGAVAEVRVAHQPERLERLEVAVHRREVGRRHEAAGTRGDLLGAERPAGGEQGGKDGPARGAQAQAAAAQRARGGSGGRRLDRRGEVRNGQASSPPCGE